VKLIITCDPENLEIAQSLAKQELTDEGWPYAKKYDRPGWGWFYTHKNVRFFVRGIKGGISVTQYSYLPQSTRAPR
jgi:hypothetical protein